MSENDHSATVNDNPASAQQLQKASVSPLAIDCGWNGFDMSEYFEGVESAALHDGRAPVIRPLAAVDWTFAALQSIPDDVCAKDIHGRIMIANKAMASRHGLAHADALIGQTAFDLLPIEAARELRDAEGRVLRSGKPEFDVEQRIVHASGQAQWIQSSRAPLYDDNRNIVGIVIVSRDISSRKESERLMLAQANLLDMIAQSTAIGEILAKIVAVMQEHLPGMTGSILLLSPDGLSFQQFTASKLPGRSPELLDNDSQGPTIKLALLAIARAEPVIVSDILADPLWSPEDDVPTGGIRAFWSSPIFCNENKPLGVLNLYASKVATPTDMQMDLIAMAGHMVCAAIERKETEERTNFLASHDMLTGLPNRLMFEERLESALEAARERRSCLALAFFDLDNFKLINDSLGHHAGDELLKIVAERAKRNLRPDDLVARLGGYEFVMFMTAMPDELNDLQARFIEIHRAVSAPINLAGRILQVTCSMGVACFPHDARKGSDLIAQADAAMYRAKAFGRDNIQVFSTDMADFAEEQLILTAQLREAIARSEFTLHYQPQVNLNTGRIFAAEALVRWRHPERGLLGPGEFIQTAEETGLIVPLGDWILFEACRQNKAWQDAGLSPIVVSVNVSARQFSERDWVMRVATALEQSGLDARFLELELTESLIMRDMAMAVGKMRELEELGVQFAIDDFGTGYSSLSVLKSLPVQRLKIDRSFVQDIPHDESDKAITAAIIVMARTLKLRTTAEGVETSDQLEFLQAHDCHEVQGFFYSKPLNADAFKDWLVDSVRTAREFLRCKPLDRRVSRLMAL